MSDIRLSVALRVGRPPAALDLTIGSSGGGCRKIVMKMSVDELRSFGENNL
jgi:hypothetical protein